MSTERYTPRSFYDRFVGRDLSSYVMLMNDPSRPYHKTYTIDLDRHTYDGHKLDVHQSADGRDQTDGHRLDQGQHAHVLLLRRGQVLQS